jgi:hypothetical protein
MVRTDTTRKPLDERPVPPRRPLPRRATDPDHLAAIGVMTPEEARKYKAYLDAVERFGDRFGLAPPQPWRQARGTLSELDSMRRHVREREQQLTVMMGEMPAAVSGRLGFYGELRDELCVITGAASGQVKQFDRCLHGVRAVLEELEHTRTRGGPPDAVGPILDHLDALDEEAQGVLRAVRAQLTTD